MNVSLFTSLIYEVRYDKCPLDSNFPQKMKNNRLKKSVDNLFLTIIYH